MSLRQRPECFILDYSSPLARGLVFAGLGNSPGSVRYKDSSSRHNDGVLTNMVPGEDWTWIDELGRWGLDFETASSKYVSTTFPVQSIGTKSFWISLWTKRSTHTTYMGLVANGQYLTAGSLCIYFYGTWNVRMYGVATANANVPEVQEWEHYCFQRIAGTGAQIFRNGEQLSVSTSANWTSADLTATYPLKVGARGSSSVSNYYNGIISDVMIGVDRVLSPSEIQILADRSDPMLGGLVKPPKRRYYAITYSPTTARFLFLKQNNKFLSFSKI